MPTIHDGYAVVSGGSSKLHQNEAESSKTECNTGTLDNCVAGHSYASRSVTAPGTDGNSAARSLASELQAPFMRQAPSPLFRNSSTQCFYKRGEYLVNDSLR
jgi:hypothetical protein